jgi:uncharacterized membrane protein
MILLQYKDKELDVQFGVGVFAFLYLFQYVVGFHLLLIVVMIQNTYVNIVVGFEELQNHVLDVEITYI